MTAIAVRKQPQGACICNSRAVLCHAVPCRPVPYVWCAAHQYGVVNEEYVIKVPKSRAPDNLQVDDQVSDGTRGRGARKG